VIILQRDEGWKIDLLIGLIISSFFIGGFVFVLFNPEPPIQIPNQTYDYVFLQYNVYYKNGSRVNETVYWNFYESINGSDPVFIETIKMDNQMGRLFTNHTYASDALVICYGNFSNIDYITKNFSRYVPMGPFATPVYYVGDLILEI